MKNYLQPGNSLDLIAPAGGVVSGVGFIIGQIFAIAVATKAAGEVVAGMVEGVYEMPKLAADNMTVGLKVNFNNTTKEMQLATSDLDGVATVVEAAGAATTTVKVKLTPL